ncbi:MAG: nucleotide-binding protein [Planctomycetes bacterium]|nr:nucleotide-binding protein [Planctomycetota bacterium]
MTKAQEVKLWHSCELLHHWCPSGSLVSRDTRAIYAGRQIPPHLEIIADVTAIRQPYVACDKLEKIARRAGSHISSEEVRLIGEQRIGTKIFIGHSQSNVWKDLKDFIQDRLHLPWDEFNRVPVAGVTNIARLSQMLDAGAIAFLIMTAEDEQADGAMHARMNVIHEAGLFQGRLGFERAIVLLENGCEEFSNIQGLGQVRFPEGIISAIFEEIRRILEREGLIES